MSTITFYRTVGTAEIALIEAAGWRAFPAMPAGQRFGFHDGPEDPREWWELVHDIEFDEAITWQDREIVDGWNAWGNDPERAMTVSFEVDEAVWRTSETEKDLLRRVNAAMNGLIKVETTYSLTEAAQVAAEMRNF